MGFNKKDSDDDFQIEVPEGESADFEQMLQASFSKNEKRLSTGDKIKGEVLSVGKENIIVSTGTRTDGILSVQDLKDARPNAEVKVGDILELYITEMGGGEIHLSPYLSNFSSKSRPGSRNFRTPDTSGAAPAMREQLKVGAQIKGKVTRIEPFGAFIEITPGTEGLAHISEISWTRIKSPSEVLKVGDIVSAQILSVEPGERKTKISLTLKQASQNPWQNLPSHVKAGNVVGGKITRCAPFGAFVELTPGVEGLIPLSEMSSTKRINRAEDVVTIGQEVSVLVKEVNTETKRISLSLKAAAESAANASEAQDMKEFSARQDQRESQQGAGDFASKMQAAIEKKNQK